jgi:hypothetical protein
MQLDLNNLPTDTELLHRLVPDIVGTIEHCDSEIEHLKPIIKQLQRISSAAVPSASMPISWRSGRKISRAISSAKKRTVRGSKSKPNDPPIASPCPIICHATMCGSTST